MTPERWQKVKEIFQSAIQRAPGERTALLASACGDDQDLRQEVESLIVAHERRGGMGVVYRPGISRATKEQR